MKNKKNILILFLVSLNITILSAQYISIPFFEIGTTFYGTKDKAKPVNGALDSSLGIRFKPGSFCYFDFKINAAIASLQNFVQNIKTKEKDKGKFDLYGASLNFPSIMGSAFSLGIFRGVYDELGNDSILQEHLKTKIEQPEFRKFYPANIFNPKNEITGTGLALYGATKKGFYTGKYIYWNEELKEKLEIGTDTRIGGNFYPFSFDLFFGVKIPKKIEQTILRAGTVMLFTASQDLKFFLEAGSLPLQIDQMENMKAKDVLAKLYASFETRIKQKGFEITLTGFLSPAYRLAPHFPVTLKDNPFAGVSTMFSFGNLEMYAMEGGFSALGTVYLNAPKTITPVSLCITPFFEFKLGMFKFDVRLPINPLSYTEIDKMFTGLFLIRTFY